MTDVLDLHDARPPRRAGRRRRRRGGQKVAGISVLLLIVIALVGGGYYGLQEVRSHFTGAPDYAGPGNGEVVIQITEGQTAAAVATTLRDKGVVASRTAFLKVANPDPRSAALKPGFYSMLKQMPAKDAFERLLDPAARVLDKVTVPEGLPLAQALTTIAEQAKLPLEDVKAAANDTAALGLPDYAHGQLEGFLFPATYEVQPDTTAASLLHAMVDRFKRAAEDVQLVQRSAALGRDPFDVVITASLIEKETAFPPDRPKVAQVVYNRLDEGMPLQFDSTVNYTREEKKARLTLDDIKQPSAYNTYENKGLPPTPIGSPGEATLKAALSPADGDYIYFVTINKSGESLFTADYDEFLKAKAKAKAEGVY